MRREMRSVRFALGALLAGATAVVACSGNPTSFGGFDAAGGGADATIGDGGERPDHTVVMKLGGGDSSTGKCVPSTCTQLKANCGPVSDPKCGGVVECGTCSGTESCGGGGPNKCGKGTSGEGGSGDACKKLTCAEQKINCGAAGDGCGGMLNCGGTCTAPQTCGGNPALPGQCGCTGTCAQVPTCEAGTTTLSGKVLDPAAKYGLYNALVYIPNDPMDPGLQPFDAGITCDVCGATAAGNPLVTALTAPDGTFTLTGVPVGTSIPLVIQLGRWRRQFTIPINNPCVANTVPGTTTLSMPQNHTQGDLPRIAFVTGALDPVECVLQKIGVDTSEFTNPGGGGYFQFFTADGEGPGSHIGGSSPTQDALFAATGGPSNGPLINNYDMTIMECEGYPQGQTQAQETALATYAGAGGRVFASDFAYTWLYAQSGVQTATPAFPGAANWAGDHSGGGEDGVVSTIVQPPTNPTGLAFQQWLQNVGVTTTGSGTVTISPAFGNANSVIAPTQQWLTGDVNGQGNTPIHFTFNTPIGATAANQCGRVTFSDWHAQQPTVQVQGASFPAECPAGALTPQQAILEFMLFDLSACIQPYTPICTPTTCAALGLQCGYAGDGCGNALDCGVCPTGQTCGGGGAGKCGTTTTPCIPETCAGQKIQCGPAGDGCGHEIQCGNCPTGDICGIDMPGQCGSTSK